MLIMQSYIINLGILLIMIQFTTQDKIRRDHVKPSRSIEYKSNSTGALKHSLPKVKLISESNNTGVEVTTNNKLENPFIIKDFQCSSEQIVCDKVKGAYKDATTRLASVLDLSQSIELQVIWKDLCVSAEDCLKTTLGQASPSAFWSVESIADQPNLDSKYMYPQALVKQYTSILDFDPYDIIIEHDAKHRDKLWFKGDSEIGSEQYEFEYLVLHELLHGLGFLSSFDQQLEKNKETLLPPLKIHPDTGHIEGIKRPFIFDKYLAYGFIPEASIDNWVNIMSEVSNVLGHLPRPQWEEQFLASPAGHLSKELYSIATTPQSLFFVIQNNYNQLLRRNEPSSKSEGDRQEEMLEALVKLTLHTPRDFISGSSISHLDLRMYQDTADFLLRPVASFGQILTPFSESDENIDLKGLMAGCIGPGIINVLASIGYKVKVNLNELANHFNETAPNNITFTSHTELTIPLFSFNLLTSFLLLALTI